MSEERNIPRKYVLWSGRARVISEQVSDEVDCEVYLDHSFENDLKFGLSNFESFLPLRLMGQTEIWLEIDCLKSRIGVLVAGGSNDSFALIPTRHPIWTTTSDRFKCGRAGIINFADYRVEGPDNPHFILRANGWVVRFIPVDGKQISFPSFPPTEKYQVTHQIEFCREDGSIFGDEIASTMLDNLSIFLSFCRGQWVATTATVYLNLEFKTAMEQWGTGRVSPRSMPSNWLDLHHGQGIVELYRAFTAKQADPGWREAFSHVVYWFSRADTDKAGPDGGFILLQTILERLAWQLLVIERESISVKGFKALTASDQIGLMLNVLSVPSAVPPRFVGLAKYAKSENLTGLQAMAAIRNNLVHPSKEAKRKEAVPHYEVYLLAQWYVEMTVLSICGYQGKYNNRTGSSRWVGEVEDVPWI